MGKRTEQEWERLLAEANQAVAYYQRIAKETADNRLRETENLSLLLTRQRQTEEALRRRHAILEAVRYAAEQFLRGPHIQEVIEPVLERLGKAAGVSRTYVFRNDLNRDGDIVTSQIHEWSAPGIASQMDNAKLQWFPFQESGFGDWEERFRRGEATVGNLEDFSLPVRNVLAAQQIQSVLIFPVSVGGRWWGMIGFDDCRSARTWNEGEMDALKAAADILGAAIHQSQDRERIEIASRAKSDFLAHMSHELRTPLNHIMGFTELILGKNFGELTPLQEEYLGDVMASGKHLLSLVNDVLDLAKVEAGKLELHLTDINLTVLLDTSLIMIREASLKQGIRLSLQTETLPETVRADERKLRQILYNLLSNAVKFTPEGGEVILTAGLATPADLPGHLATSDGSVLAKPRRWLGFSVRDTGIGIRREDLERLFNPFEQVENVASRKYQGTGLGLSLARSFVELHGGAIWAESSGEGRGSAFRFFLPL
jgi:signal transduction histidine kinase